MTDEKATALVVAQMVCGYVYSFDKSHWAPSVPYPCTPCMTIAGQIVDVDDRDDIEGTEILEVPEETWEPWELALEKRLPSGYDWEVKVETGNESAWSAEVRVTPNPNNHAGPDRSYVTFATGGATPNQVLEAAVEGLMAWIDKIEP